MVSGTLSMDVKIIKDYELLKYLICILNIVNLWSFSLLLFVFKNTNFKQVLKNKFKFF